MAALPRSMTYMAHGAGGGPDVLRAATGPVPVPAAGEILIRVLAAGVTCGCVLADAAYGASAAFRHALSARGLTWAVGIAKTQTVYPADVALTTPRATTGRPRTHPVPTRPREAAGDVLARARSGAFPLEKMKRYTENYQRAGGTGDFSRYYSVRGDQAVFSPTLVDGDVFAPHNLAQDAAFNEFQLIVCRNVLIYFDTDAKRQVLDTPACARIHLSGVWGMHSSPWVWVQVQTHRVLSGTAGIE